LSKPDLAEALKDGARTSAGSRRRRLRSVLVVAEVALAVVLLVGAALFIGSFVSLMRIDPGFSPDNVLTAQVSPRYELRSVVRSPTNRAPVLAELVDRIQQIPGVLNASTIAGGLPLGGVMITGSITVRGQNIDRNAGGEISVRKVTAQYHNALRIPLRRGRLLLATDRKGAANVAILNESAARKYFPGHDPVGRTVTIEDEDRSVVGVVGDVHQTSLETEPRAEAYIPLEQSLATGGELVIRTSGPPYDVLPAVRAATYAVLPDVPLRNVMTMEELVGKRVAQRRVNMLLLGLFGLLGLVISAVGIYGVMAYAVSQRTREIGVRMALGATRSRVIGMVLGNACALVGAGLLIGGVGAWYLSATARAFLFNMQPTDPRAFAAALLLLALAALIASAIPARRAASVDPMIALRSE
jgi:predicted permease